MQYVGDDDSKLADEITVEQYMTLSEDEKKVWTIIDPDEIEGFEELEFDLEKSSIEVCTDLLE